MKRSESQQDLDDIELGEEELDAMNRLRVESEE